MAYESHIGTIFMLFLYSVWEWIDVIIAIIYNINLGHKPNVDKRSISMMRKHFSHN